MTTYQEFGSVKFNGIEYALTDRADFTNRLLPGGYTNYNDAAEGEKYDFEMSASAVDSEGDRLTVYWIFKNTKGLGAAELDTFDYSIADRIEV